MQGNFIKLLVLHFVISASVYATVIKKWFFVDLYGNYYRSFMKSFPPYFLNYLYTFFSQHNKYLGIFLPGTDNITS